MYQVPGITFRLPYHTICTRLFFSFCLRRPLVLETGVCLFSMGQGYRMNLHLFIYQKRKYTRL